MLLPRRAGLLAITATMLALALPVCAAAPGALGALTPAAQDRAGEPADDNNPAAAEEAERDAPEEAADGGFDPAVVALPGFPEAFDSPAAFDKAINLIDARVDELRGASVVADATDAEAETGAVAAAGADGPVAAPGPPAPEPRIEALLRLRREVRFDRAHFVEYGDYALLFEVVYYVLGADYNLYMDTQQAINLAIHRRFKAEGIDFAYPTREIILRQSDAPRTAAGAAQTG
jgi:hypothetical protein